MIDIRQALCDLVRGYERRIAALENSKKADAYASHVVDSTILAQEKACAEMEPGAYVVDEYVVIISNHGVHFEKIKGKV